MKENNFFEYNVSKSEVELMKHLCNINTLLVICEVTDTNKRTFKK